METLKLATLILAAGVEGVATLVIGIASATYDIVGFPPLRIQDAATAKTPS